MVSASRWRNVVTNYLTVRTSHPALKREDQLGKHPFAGFGTDMEDIKRTKVIASKLLSVYVVERYIGGGGQI